MLIKPQPQRPGDTIRACLTAVLWLGGLLAVVLSVVAACHSMLR